MIKSINDDFLTIRHHGRQYFLEMHPSGFSRVLHDYLNERKGFVVWKDMVESLLV
jgi:hypothetical protein